ncbi:MAG TPA: CheR family methyltransferase [Bryobacteraceae bacterium]|nr:CheR family methyltransferase [Bryobacteraceae bacterium]
MPSQMPNKEERARESDSVEPYTVDGNTGPLTVTGAEHEETGETGKEEAERRENGLEETEGQRLPFLVAGIGASAGGVEAYISLFEQLPADTGMAFVVVLHLAPDQKSHLPEILTRHSTMPIVSITSGTRPEPNHVYVLGANARVRLVDGRFLLEGRSPDAQARSIDTFFRSLASAQKNRAIGVILSGMDGDGAMGLKAIKGEGGITMVQTPESARFPDMPRTSISADHVDIVLPPGALGAYLAQLGRQFKTPELRRLDSEEAPPEDSQFVRVLALMRSVSGIDFRLYKPNTIRRRIARRMLLHHIDSLATYETFLRANPREIRDLQEDSLISVTRFFRDPDVFDTLRTTVFPRIFDSRESGQPVRIWVAGCSTGEEVYSLGICMLEYMTAKQEDPSIQIFGTDASEQNIQKARAGLYSDAITADVSPERLRRFFTKSDKGYQVARRVRDLCIFARQNLCHDPPFSRMDLISCRNVLIYFGADLQRQLIPTFHYALRPAGFLLLGASETIREFTDLFSMADRKNKIFSRIPGSVARPRLDLAAPLFAPDLRAGVPALGDSTEGWGNLELQRAADRIVLARYAPPGVVVNERMEILQSRGHTNPWFEMPQGPATLSLSRLARQGVGAQLTEAVKRSIETDAPVETELIPLHDSEQAQTTLIEVLPIQTIRSRPRCYVVLFAPSRKQALEAGREIEAFPPQTADEKDRLVAKVRQDLAAARLYLQSLLEERDAKNQELVSANEEIQSANEELQSTNEELETTKEELQSSNEELQTVNDELQNRNLVLTQASNDLSNLLNSVSLPVLMLSNDLNIRHFTPHAQRLMNLRPSDIGRPFAEIRMNLEIETLDPLLTEVLETLTARETEVRDREGKWHLLRIRPYRTADNKIEGLVVVLVDIDQLRRSQQELQVARDFARMVVEGIPLPLAVVDLEFRIHSVNEAFSRLTDTPAVDLESRSLPEIAAAVWGSDQPLRSHLTDLGTSADAGRTFEFVQNTPGDNSRVLSIRGCVVKPDGENFLLITVQDITAHKEIERLLQVEGERLVTEVDRATSELRRSQEQLRALTGRLFALQEEERRRVARELHDDVGQRLARLEIGRNDVEQQLQLDPASAHGKLQELHEALRQLSQDVRGISDRLHPSILEDRGLAFALRTLSDEFRDREHMPTTFSERDVPQSIPLELALGLYRIAQEALRNVARHAGKTHVKVSLQGKAGRVHLQITDAGNGFDTANTPFGPGLVSMEERARQMGATFQLESTVGEGTRITLEVPPTLPG